MDRRERSKYEVLARLNEFGREHRALFPDSTVAGEAFAQVAQAVAAIDAHATAKPVAAQNGRSAKIAARAALRAAMSNIARAARTLAADDKRRALLRMPARKSDAVLLHAAPTFAEQAEPVQAEFIKLGLSRTFVADLREATDRLAAEVNERRIGRRHVTEAQRGITHALMEGFSAVRQLDVLVPHALKDHPEALAGWQRDRRLVGTSRRRLGAAPVDATAPDPTPRDVATETLDKAS